MKLSSEVKEDLQDQADQIIYFEAAMSNEDKAAKAVYERLVEIYKVAFKEVQRILKSNCSSPGNPMETPTLRVRRMPSQL